MEIKQYKTGDFVIEIRSEQAIIDAEPYSAFLCYDEPANHVINIYFVSELPRFDGETVAEKPLVRAVRHGDYCAYYYHAATGGDFACRAESEKGADIYVLEKYSDQMWDRVMFNIMGFEEIAGKNGCAVLHSSFVEYKGQAVLFTAPCGTGKSTQAELWRKHRGANIINGDKSLIYVREGRAYAAGLPYAGSSNMCKNEIYPVAAVVRLGQAPENSIERVFGFKAFSVLYKGVYPVTGNSVAGENQLAAAEAFSRLVPVFRLDCTPDERAVECLEKAMYGDGEAVGK